MRITGLTGLLDVEGLVRQLMQVERRPLARLQEQRAELDAMRAAWADLRAKLEGLVSTLDALTAPGAFQARTATSSAPTVVAATAAPGAAPGTYTLTVSQLATAHRVASDRVTDPAAPLGYTGQVTVNGVAIAVTAGMSLYALADAIQAAGAGVRAMVVDGQLLLEAERTGAANAIRVSDPNGILQALGVIDATGAFRHVLQAPQDAQLTFNGVAVARPTNAITDLVAGVTFHLQATSATAVTVTVSVDAAAVRSRVQAFLDAYNQVYGRLNELLAKGSRFQGDGTLLRLQRALRSLATGVVAGAPGGYDQLALVGITARGGPGVPQAEQGLLTLDAARFDQALTTNPAAMEKLFTAAVSGGDAYDGVVVRLRAEARRWAGGGGLLELQLQSVDDQLRRLSDRIAATEARLSRREEELYRQFARLEQALATLEGQRQWLAGMVESLERQVSR